MLTIRIAGDEILHLRHILLNMLHAHLQGSALAGIFRQSQHRGKFLHRIENLCIIGTATVIHHQHREFLGLKALCQPNERGIRLISGD